MSATLRVRSSDAIRRLHVALWQCDGARDIEDAHALNARIDELADLAILCSALIAYPFQAENDTPFDELVDSWSDAGFEELVFDYPGPFLSR